MLRPRGRGARHRYRERGPGEDPAATQV